jgi:hypothetical protein
MLDSEALIVGQPPMIPHPIWWVLLDVSQSLYRFDLVVR